MPFRKLLLPVIPLITFLVSCAPEQSKIVVAEYGNYNVYMDEFEKAYSRNTGGVAKAKTDSLENMKNFLDLYVNYKMKLRDAVVRGYTSDPDMKKELIDYKKNIGTTLFLEDKLYEPALRKMYERRKTEILAAHIMLIPDSLMNDSQVRELGIKLIERINKGEDFAKLAAEYSKDQYTNTKGGVVGWVTAGIIVVPAIEEAIYNTEPGKIHPELVISNYGFHILKVIEKMPRRDQIKAQHILVAFKDSAGVVDSSKAFNKILEIQKELNQGADFNKLALKYSDDKMSADQYGDLGYFSRGRMDPNFEDAVFRLKVGEVSQIIKSYAGYHLVKLNAESPYPAYEQSAEELKDMFLRTTYRLEYDKILSQLRQDYNYQLNREVFARIMNSLHSIPSYEAFDQSDVRKQYGQSILFSYADKSSTVDSLFSFMKSSSQFSARNLTEELFAEAINVYLDKKLLEEKALSYDKENSNFAFLMEEYENGIYLFKILEDEVWSKISVDSIMIQDYFEKHRENYRWKDRVEFQEIYAISDTAANRYYNLALSGENFDSLVTRYSLRKGYDNIPGYKGLMEIDVNELSKKADSLPNIGDISKPFRFQDGWSVIKLIKREPARLKNLDEVKPEIISLLQELESKRLESVYLNKLKEIYKPKYYYDELMNAFKN